MSNQILQKEQLENILKKNWSEFLDHLRLMRLVMEDVRDTPFKEITQESIPALQIKISVTKFRILNESNTPTNYQFEFWLEYSMPKQEGIVIGTNIYLMNLNGEIHLQDSFGTHFKPKIIK